MKVKKRGWFVVSAALVLAGVCNGRADDKPVAAWSMGTPITTYYAGPGYPKVCPPLDDKLAKQIADGGFNLAWSGEEQLDIAQRHGLRAQLVHELLKPQTMDDPTEVAKLDALIERVKNHPALYNYYIMDEPNASLFPALGKLVAHLRERDPAHPAYINLFPSYAKNHELGTTGDTITAYSEHLRLFIEQVKPDILSYDHYHFKADGTDGMWVPDLPPSYQYFLNLGLIRQAALDAGIPFMNIVQACYFHSNVRAPNGQEMRWLNYTSLAYGAQALSYFVYSIDGFYQDAIGRGVDPGQMMRPDGSTTPQYAAARELNPQFIAIASQLQPLRSMAAYHEGTVPWGAVALPENAPFSLDFSGAGMSQMPAEGMLLGYFGKAGNPTEPTHVLVVNLNYKNTVTTTVVGPARLELFDTATRQWTRADGSRMTVTLPPGGGTLVRAFPMDSLSKVFPL